MRAIALRRLNRQPILPQSGAREDGFALQYDDVDFCPACHRKIACGSFGPGHQSDVAARLTGLIVTIPGNAAIQIPIACRLP